MNLFTKRIATISGSIFTLTFFTIFEITEKMNQKKHAQQVQGLSEDHHIDEVNLRQVQVLTPQECALTQPVRIVVAVRDPRNLFPLKHVLEETDSKKSGVVVMIAKLAKNYHLDGYTAPRPPICRRTPLYSDYCGGRENRPHGDSHDRSFQRPLLCDGARGL